MLSDEEEELKLRNEALGDITIYNQKNSVSKDKIKAKIEEVKDGTYDAKIILESLLEKE